MSPDVNGNPTYWEHGEGLAIAEAESAEARVAIAKYQPPAWNGDGPMQAKHIAALPILRFLVDLGEWGCIFDPQRFANSVRIAMPPNTPEKVAAAKMRAMIARGLVTGCVCGCRGDFEPTEKGRAELQRLEGTP